METNREIAEVFDEIADLLELDRANVYRVQAYRQVAQRLREESRDVSLMVKRGDDITTIPGVGENSAAIIRELVLVGESHYVTKIRQQTPAMLRRFLQIPGLGPVRIKTLYFRLGIRTVSQLRQAAEKGRLRHLPGFGPTIERRIAEYLACERVAVRL